MTASSKYRNIYSRFIPREEVGHATLVHFGNVGAPDLAGLPAVDTRTPEERAAEEEALRQALIEQERQERAQRQRELQEACEKASTQAYAHGLEQGRTEANLEWQQRFDDYVNGQAQEHARRLEAVAQELQHDLAVMQQHMSQEILELACQIARQVVRQELRASPHALLPVIREALDMVVADGRPSTVRLNPDDYVVVADALRAEVLTPAVQWVADAGVTAGSCMVECAGSVVDGTLEKRWLRAIAPLGLALEWQTEPGVTKHDD